MELVVKLTGDINKYFTKLFQVFFFFFFFYINLIPLLVLLLLTDYEHQAG